MNVVRRVTWAALFVLSSQPALANPLSDAWSCAKGAGMTQVAIGKELYKKGEAVATMAGPLAACLAKTGPEAQALMATSSALTALRLSSPSLLGDQCEARLKSVATKPFAEALSALLPSGQARAQLIAAARSEQSTQIVWDEIGQLPPPFSMVPGQVSCGCLISDGGLSLSDVSEVTTAAAKAGASCGKLLDSLGYGVIKDIGGYALKLGKAVVSGVSDKWDELVGGQSSPASPDNVFQDYFGQFLEGTAQNMTRDPSSWSSKIIGYHKGSCSTYEPVKCQVTLGQMWSECVDYYDDHKMSAGHAKQVCNGFRDALIAAATVRAQHLKARGDLPEALGQRIATWIDKDWLWRMPKYDNGSGSIIDWKGASNTLFLDWNDIWGFASYPKGGGIPGKGDEDWDYKAFGLYATARAMLLELGNNPGRAADLAYAGAQNELRLKALGVWYKRRKGHAQYQLDEWYPRQTFGERYGCPNELAAVCAEVMETDYDKHCFPFMSHLYVTQPQGMGFAPAYQKVAKGCRTTLDQIVTRAAKLAQEEASVTASLVAACAGRSDRNERGDCTAGVSTAYRNCAAKALREGRDDASNCFARAPGPTPGLPAIRPIRPPAGLVPPRPTRQPATSTLCRFTSGPRAGQVQDYAPMAPLPVGSSCQDARGSRGVVIARD